MSNNHHQAGPHLALTVTQGMVHLRLRVRLRWLLASLAALVTLSGSPALLAALDRLTG